MLQSIRDRAQGWIAWLAVIVISVVFAVWGVDNYLDRDPNVTVAQINDAEIPLTHFQNAYRRHRARLQSMLGATIDVNSLDEQQLKRDTLDQLVHSELLLQAGAQDGMTISDAQLAAAIQTQEELQINGVFSQEIYEQALRSQGHTPGSYEYELRRSLLVEQTTAAIAPTALVTDEETDRFLALVGQEREYTTLTVESAPLGAAASVSDEEIEAYYSQHRTQFHSPEQVRIAYVELERAKLAEALTVDEELLQGLYEEAKAHLGVPESRRARHILVNVASDADEAAVAAATDRLAELRGRIDAGESFESLAKAHSEDSGSAGQGGDLGFFGRGVMDKRFEDAAFDLSADEISEPVRSDFGLHLIQVTEIRPARTKSFEEARPQLLREYQSEQTEGLFYEHAERLANLAFEQSHSLEVAAETLGLTIHETEYFDRDGGEDPVTTEPKVLAAAFDPEVLEEGRNSEALELEGDRVIVLRVREHQQATQLDLAEVRDEIVTAVRDEKGRAEALAVGTSTLERLRAGEAPEGVATEAGLQWTEPKTATRSVFADDQEVVKALFRMPRPTTDNAVLEGIVTGTGDYVVIHLTSVTDGDVSAADQTRRVSAHASLAQSYGLDEYRALVATLRAGAEVVVHEGNL